MKSDQKTILPNRNVPELIEDIQLLTKEIQELYCQDNSPLVVGWSGGKDSTTVLQLVWNAIELLPIEKRTKTIYVITNDTLVENPIVAAWVRNSLNKLQEAATKKQMPIKTKLTFPSVEDTFWSCLIGKGYPAPRKRFRWCTERMKIKPTDFFIRDIIRDEGEAILVLGTRKAESITRARNMEWI